MCVYQQYVYTDGSVSLIPVTKGDHHAKEGDTLGGPAGAKRPQQAKRVPAERTDAFQYLQLENMHAKNYT